MNGREAAAHLRAWMAQGRLDLPRPGRGLTPERFRALASLTREDVALGRLGEAHTDAVSILAEAGRSAERHALYGVWAADFPGSRITATPRQAGWRLEGVRHWCSGAGSLDLALVTATGPDGPLLFTLPLQTPGLTFDPASWRTPALADTTTWTVELHQVDLASDRIVGGVGFYTERPGFWQGSVGVAAAWAGGALGLLDDFDAAVLSGLKGQTGHAEPDGHRLAHLGAVHAACYGAMAAIETAAREIDADPGDAAGAGYRRALMVRQLVERAATEVIDRCARGLGPAPLALDAGHARRVADLQLYVRQHHAEADLEAIARTSLAATSDDPAAAPHEPPTRQ
jgi:alkylation response protein AidB-like acyl-CoA dehydrogenase